MYYLYLELLLYGGTVHGNTLTDIWKYRVSQDDWTHQGNLLAASIEHVAMAVTGIQCPWLFSITSCKIELAWKYMCLQSLLMGGWLYYMCSFYSIILFQMFHDVQPMIKVLCNLRFWINRHFTSFHFISFHFISFHFISFHLISSHFISIRIERSSSSIM